MIKILENTTGLRMSPWEKHGLKRVYIEKKIGMGHDLYFDVEKMAMCLRSGKDVSKQWPATKISESLIRVESKQFKITGSCFLIEID